MLVHAEHTFSSAETNEQDTVVPYGGQRRAGFFGCWSVGATNRKQAAYTQPGSAAQSPSPATARFPMCVPYRSFDASAPILADMTTSSGAVWQPAVDVAGELDRQRKHAT